MLPLLDLELERFWQIAASPIPVIIIGGGRWGRTWSIAVSRARNSGAGVTIAARTDAISVRTWVKHNSGFPEITVVENVSGALERYEALGIAIISSRPRDHVRDGMEAISKGLDVLVEKPISDVAKQGADLVSAAKREGRLIAVGTEFALLPCFHQCAREIQAKGDSLCLIRLYWDDPSFELRHGALKRQHDETSVLVDLLPHAYSIFRIFSGGAALCIEDAREDKDLELGWLRMRGELGVPYELHCNKQSNVRRRILELETRSGTTSIDFSDENPCVLVNGKKIINEFTLHMRSSLRLALGAFIAEHLDHVDSTPLSESIDYLIHLQGELESLQG